MRNSICAGTLISYNPEIHARRSTRLPNYDYSQRGAYFVTFCVAGRRCIFGGISDGEIRLNKLGQFVAEQWSRIPKYHSNAVLDAFVIMPNHVHGIIHLIDAPTVPVGAGFQPAQTPHQSKPNHGLSEIIRAFKTYTARRINGHGKSSGEPAWQRNYYEHVVRNEKDLDAIRKYIVENPLKWELDPENPAVRGMVNAERSGLKTRAYGRR